MHCHVQTLMIHALNCHLQVNMHLDRCIPFSELIIEQQGYYDPSHLFIHGGVMSSIFPYSLYEMINYDKRTQLE